MELLNHWQLLRSLKNVVVCLWVPSKVLGSSRSSMNWMLSTRSKKTCTNSFSYWTKVAHRHSSSTAICGMNCMINKPLSPGGSTSSAIGGSKLTLFISRMSKFIKLNKKINYTATPSGDSIGNDNVFICRNIIVCFLTTKHNFAWKTQL